jgi:GNAT superfamily N-acetyltransferase
MTPVTVRPAASADIPQLLALVRRYWEYEHIPGFEALRVELLLKRLIATPHLGAAWVAEAEGRLAGYLIAVMVLSLEHGGLMGEIDEFFVLPEARAQGVGARLLEAAEAALAARGCVRLQLQLATGNAIGRDFYEHRGYRARDGYRLLDRALQAAPAGAGAPPGNSPGDPPGN